ncbi:hypothetical protein NDU88_006213 [Pleurodeles waltl]|uniref:Uncharacterized protein n=1 Tax=Pleurodeles waltl TaxID=8319 RepID=A0AAV7X0X1_PLEWA|nr:hypothetical protein NDU88_006213 [Pleurodeles waltl]
MPGAHPWCIRMQRDAQRVASNTILRNREPTLIVLKTLHDPGGGTRSPSQLPPLIARQHPAAAPSRRNIDSEQYSFNLSSQERDESMGEFISRLKRLARYCAFDAFTTENALRLQIIEGCQSKSLRIRLLKK